MKPLLTMQWEHVLFLHWEADPEAVQAQLPEGMELDTFNGRAVLGIIPFWMTGISLTRLPALSRLSFPELNLRTYVRVNGRPGIYFFFLDASHPLANRIANTFFLLPYRPASFHVSDRDAVSFQHRQKKGEAFHVQYRPDSPVFEAKPGSFAWWATERYHFFTKKGKSFWQGDIQHRPWPLQRARAAILENTISSRHMQPGPMLEPFYSRKLAVTAAGIKRVQL
ncbi:YqjF family protein [Bacillus daqingensis]|uniref:YqjF family protein n=1 Tax=Bacillus daqingensis TaxID=872396 RepID=A0ABV9NZE1_9BACI